MEIKCLNFKNLAIELYDQGQLKKSISLFEKAKEYADLDNKLDILYSQGLIYDEL